MNRYFRGVTPPSDNNSQNRQSRPAEPPPNTYNQGRTGDFNPQDNRYSLNQRSPEQTQNIQPAQDMQTAEQTAPPQDTQNTPNAAINTPFYPTEEQSEEFNNNLAGSIMTQNPAQMTESPQMQNNTSVPYTGMGSLIIQAFTADQALPIENVKITITSDDEQLRDIHEVRYTNSSGRTEAVPLPAPSMQLSQQPQFTEKPYAVYNVVSEIDGYTANNLPINAVVFDKIQSIQNIPLIANRENE